MVCKENNFIVNNFQYKSNSSFLKGYCVHKMVGNVRPGEQFNIARRGY